MQSTAFKKTLDNKHREMRFRQIIFKLYSHLYNIYKGKVCNRVTQTHLLTQSQSQHYLQSTFTTLVTVYTHSLSYLQISFTCQQLQYILFVHEILQKKYSINYTKAFQCYRRQQTQFNYYCQHHSIYQFIIPMALHSHWTW